MAAIVKLILRPPLAYRRVAFGDKWLGRFFHRWYFLFLISLGLIFLSSSLSFPVLLLSLFFVFEKKRERQKKWKGKSEDKNEVPRKSRLVVHSLGVISPGFLAARVYINKEETQAIINNPKREPQIDKTRRKTPAIICAFVFIYLWRK